MEEEKHYYISKYDSKPYQHHVISVRVPFLFTHDEGLKEDILEDVRAGIDMFQADDLS